MSGDRWLGYPQTFRDGDDCPDWNEWCSYPDDHTHGFGCDATCPCRVEPARWTLSTRDKEKRHG